MEIIVNIIKSITDSIGIPNIVLYFIILNLLGFGIMAIDKYKAQKRYWRTPEKTIFTVTLLGGGIGTVIGMYMFKHKTKKPNFTIGLPTILISEILIIIYLTFFV